MTDFRWGCIVVASLLFALMGAAGWWWKEPPSSARDQPKAAADLAPPTPADAYTGAGAMHPNPTVAFTGLSADVPNSMPGLHPAQLFEIGFGGGLIINADTRRAIETLLMNMSAGPSADELERLRAALREGLPFDDAEEVMKLLGNYREYSADMSRQLHQMEAPQTSQEVNEYFERVESIQRQHLGETTAAAFFEQEMLLARLSMQTVLINHDPHLDDTQKQAQIAALRARLPAHQQNLLPPAAIEETVSAGSVSPANRKPARGPNG
ncbi:hypothetical protein M8A51_01765 [Schlegelella sp. S2-27]|uniref:Lipase helper protein n=1 Tax=Caldimonas mangrovi TaxID=2944811 RepID=A0ABT0YHQ7_9BURK|nr:lipase secretion chaperone [Caldimonas mangrovi]MCM5678250.1 hypothetical protein [Caldimonas mangrovi]